MTKAIHEGAIRNEMASDSKHSKALIREFSIELFNAIRKGLLEDGHVRLHQFGSFKIKWSAQRNGINPQTGESLIIPAQPRINFTAAKALKEKIALSDNTLAQPLITNEAISITSEIIADIKPVQTASTPKPIPEIDREPYLKKIIPTESTENSSTQISYKAMAAGFILICSIAYFIIPMNTDKSMTVAQADNSASLKSPDLESTVSKPLTKDIIHSSTDKVPSTVINNSLQSPIEATAVTDLQNNNANKDVFFASRKYKLIDGNSLWRLSKKNYINPFYWPHIYQANQYTISNPDRLITGKTITLPTLHGHPDSLTAQDKHNIAEGYFLAYRYYKKTNKPHPYYALLGAVKYDPAIIDKHIFEIADDDWESIQIASN
ncbi:MAG: HU family DNA-binding protein [Gammaproteobacteria bacterium]|nr:HU family DNA-binding protein [Gammaproteobacteria bacterium]